MRHLAAIALIFASLSVSADACLSPLAEAAFYDTNSILNAMTALVRYTHPEMEEPTVKALAPLRLTPPVPFSLEKNRKLFAALTAHLRLMQYREQYVEGALGMPGYPAVKPELRRQIVERMGRANFGADFAALTYAAAPLTHRAKALLDRSQLPPLFRASIAAHLAFQARYALRYHPQIFDAFLSVLESEQFMSPVSKN